MTYHVQFPGLGLALTHRVLELTGEGLVPASLN